MYDMRPGMLFTRVAKGWYYIEILRGFTSARTQAARKFFFEVYGQENLYSNIIEDHPQYITDREIIAEICWETTKNVLKQISYKILNQLSELRSIISNEQFIKCWGDLTGEQLKTAPRNFDKAHPDMDLIKFKSFYFMKSFTDQEVLSKDFSSTVSASFKTARPFLNFMSDVLTTDLNGESLL